MAGILNVVGVTETETTVIVKVIGLLFRPPTLTTTLPVVAPVGTGTAMVAVLQNVGVAATPLNVTVLVPWAAPKLVPVSATDVPTGPDVGERIVMLGATPKGTPLLARPLTVTTTFPVVAPAGTGTTMLVAPQLVGEDAAPLKVTVLVPCVAAKFVPVMVMEVPTVPEPGLKLVMAGRT